MPRSNQVVFAPVNVCLRLEHARDPHLVRLVLLGCIRLVVAVHVPVGLDRVVALIALSVSREVAHINSVFSMRCLVHLSGMRVQQHVR